jgi:uncharacterized membrane protein YoaK (UPF0700 family)
MDYRNTGLTARVGTGPSEKAADAGLAHAPLAGMALAFSSGYVDTVGFVVLFGLFATHLTGNLVILGAQLVDGQGGMQTKLLAVPVFLLVVVVVTALADRAHSSARSLAACFAAETLLLALFMLAGVSWGPFADPDQWAAMVTGLLAVSAMAVRNALCRIHLPMCPPITVMTGNVTQMVMDLTRWAMNPAHNSAVRAQSRASMRRHVPGLMAFLAGVMCGAWAYAALGFLALVCPVLVSAALTRQARMQADQLAQRQAEQALKLRWQPTQPLIDAEQWRR